LVGVEDTLRTKNMYRDDGGLAAKARRDELASERRLELAMMPLTLAHVFAHRVARAAAGAAALVVALGIVAVLAEPKLLRFAEWAARDLTYLTRLDIFVLLTGFGVLTVYMFAAWIAGGWFARRMRATIRTSDEPDRDLDELACGPIEIAQQTLKRVDAVSIGLFLTGGVALTLALGYVGVMLETNAHHHYSIFDRSLLSPPSLERNVDVLVLGVFMTIGFGAWFTRAVHLGRAGILRVLGHVSTFTALSALGFALAYLGLDTLTNIAMEHALPTERARYALGVGVTVVITGLATGVLLWWRRRELARTGE
jgi:hypothetical protein